MPPHSRRRVILTVSAVGAGRQEQIGAARLARTRAEHGRVDIAFQRVQAVLRSHHFADPPPYGASGISRFGNISNHRPKSSCAIDDLGSLITALLLSFCRIAFPTRQPPILVRGLPVKGCDWLLRELHPPRSDDFGLTPRSRCMSIRPSNEHLLKWVKSVYFPQAALAEAGMSLELDSAVGERLKFGEFELAPVARALWRRGEQVRLGSRALDILIALASRPGQIVSKDDLTQLVWRGAFVDETALRVGISAVRKALGLGGDRYIATVPGRGYCFVLDVETTPAKPTAEPPQIERLKPQRLPAQIARVVGRDEVIATLAAEGTRRRLLSLVGAGGIGKTTVAVAVADRLRADLDAVAFVDLAPIENGTQMSAAAAAALGINLRLHEDRVDQIAVAVEDRRVLIVLDNCEHLVDAAAAFVEALLSSARGVTILATSRERLRAAGEWVHQLSPLEAPPESSTVSAEEVRGYPAVELFEERAAFALGGYQISDTDAPYVAEICRRLDGIALAIELAAGRLAGFGVQALANSLEDCFSILTAWATHSSPAPPNAAGHTRLELPAPVARRPSGAEVPVGI